MRPDSALDVTDGSEVVSHCGPPVTGPTSTGAAWATPALPLESSVLVVVESASPTWATMDVASGATTLVDSGWWSTSSIPLCLPCRSRVAVNRTPAAFLFPAGPKAVLGGAPLEGLARAVGSEFPPYSGTAEPLTVTTWTTPTGALNGAVEVVFHLAPEVGADVQPGLITAVATANAALSGLGLEVHDQGHVTLPAGFGTVGTENVDVLFAQGTPVGVRRIPVYITVSLTATDDRALDGTTPVPGPLGSLARRPGPILVWTPAGVPGVTRPQALGRVLAHELGHFLGLFHTRELGSTVVDPLVDTPEGSSDNLMDPQLLGVEVTPTQRRIVHGHPAVLHDCTSSP